MTSRDGGPQQVLEEHRSLRKELAELEKVASASPASGASEAWIDELARRIGGLRPRLERHFDLEMASGFFEEIERAWPNASAECGSLVKDHRRYLDRLDGLLRSLATRSVSDASIASVANEVRSIIADLHRHETRENDLFYTALEGGPGALD